MRPSMAVMPRMRGSDGPREAQEFGHVIRDCKNLRCRQAVEALVQDTCESPGGGCFSRRLEVEPHAVRRTGVVLFRLNGQEQRRLALDDLLKEFRVVLQPVRKLGEPLGELQQQLQPLGFGQGLEVVNYFRQRGGKGLGIHQVQFTPVPCRARRPW